MTPAKPTLSSRDPSTKSIAVRLPADLAAAIEAACKQHGISASEFLRGLVSQWVYGQSQLAGPDEGYTSARAMASQLAHAALRKALAELPDSHEAARTMLAGYQEEQTERRRKPR